jgi:glycosyltransferase involved in cell wall biosynthesis
MKHPTISAVVPVHNSESYVGEALTAILSQTRPPDEVIVVDDGSTDGSQDELQRFRGEIRVVKQANRGVAGAMNRCYEESRCAYVAKCDADDIWEPEKLERQVEALRAHPQIDIALAGARFIGLKEGLRAPYSEEGVLNRTELARRLYCGNFICSCATLVRRRLHQQLGPFDEEIACEDYDFWLRALSAGATFFYDPTALVRCRAHPGQVSSNVLRMNEAEYITHHVHSDVAGDPRLVNRVLARDLSNIARALSDQDRPREARTVFMSSLGRRPTLRVMAWVIVLSLPPGYRRPIADRLVSTKRALISAFRRLASGQAST